MRNFPANPDGILLFWNQEENLDESFSQAREAGTLMFTVQ
jgi:hypothetical protein